MARIVGVDIPRNKKINYSLQYIHGIGKKQQMLCALRLTLIKILEYIN